MNRLALMNGGIAGGEKAAELIGERHGGWLGHADAVAAQVAELAPRVARLN